MKKAAIFFSLLTTLVSTSSMANSFSEVDDYIRKNKEIIQLNSGTAVAVIKDDEIVYEGYFGYADIQQQTPVDQNTVFYIASITKAFFALNTLLLEHKGKVDTQRTLHSMFPAVPFQPALQSDRVTIKDLLRHTSGIDNWPLVQVTAYTGQHDNDLLSRIIQESYINPNAPLGTFHYTNVGYNIVSHWMDNTFETNWQTQLADNIFSPLNMFRTSARISDAKKNDWLLARGYSVKSHEPTEPVYLTKTDDSMQSAGGIITTAKDLANFVRMQVNKGKFNGKQVFPEAVIEKSHQSLVSHTMFGSKQEYGWGWFLRDIFGERILEHRGGYAGASTYVSFIPNQKVGLVVLSNQDKWGGDLAYALEKIVYAIALNKPEEEIRSLVEKRQLYAQDAAKKFYENKTLIAPVKNNNLDTQFAGNFVHDTLGKIAVSQKEDGSFHLAWGNLRSTLLNGEQPNELSIEFVPGRNEEIVFMEASNKQQYLKYREYYFRKAN
ncbi:serine hydrolase domain-containing protein [Alteromonas gracilis]|uniref:serine hydrolase domain-containing protein n=1 Tax=Alteromonas gracilis TaxID=1479524 RepID=UPI003736A71E